VGVHAHLLLKSDLLYQLEIHIVNDNCGKLKEQTT